MSSSHLTRLKNLLRVKEHERGNKTSRTPCSTLTLTIHGTTGVDLSRYQLHAWWRSAWLQACGVLHGWWTLLPKQSRHDLVTRWTKLLNSLQRRSCVVLWLSRLPQLSMMLPELSTTETDPESEPSVADARAGEKACGTSGEEASCAVDHEEADSKTEKS